MAAPLWPALEQKIGREALSNCGAVAYHSPSLLPIPSLALGAGKLLARARGW
jgi:hypothetical protein